MNAFTMARIKTRLSKIDALRSAIEDEKISYKRCMMLRKETAKCSVHKKNIAWAKSEIEDLKYEVKVLHSKIND